MNWTPLNIADVLNAPRPVLDCVLPGLPVGTVGNLVAPGSTGKTQFLLQLAVARCLGLPAIGGLFPAARPEHVLMVVAEENAIIMTQRLHDLVDGLVEQGLFAGAQRADLIAELNTRLRLFPLTGQDVRLVKDACFTEVLTRLVKLGEGVRLVIADPLRRFHDGDENDSGAMTQLVQAFEHIAQQTGAAVLLSHHTSKAAVLNGQGESQQAGRGSSALTDGVRWQANLTGMSTKAANELRLAENEARFYVRFDISKSNYGPPQAPVWLRRQANGVLTRSELPGARSRKPTKESAREVVYD